MGQTYRKKDSKLHPGKIKAVDYKHIGRLLRACAEIENLLSLYLFELADVDRECGIALIGKAPAKSRLVIAQKLAGTGTDIAQKLRECFIESGHKEAVDARNCLAHGTFLGLDDDGRYTFENEVWELEIEEDERVLYTQTVAFSGPEIGHLATSTEKLIPVVEKKLGLRSLRQKLRQLPLRAHPKAHRPKRGQTKP
jgi:hypothetical protein